MDSKTSFIKKLPSVLIGGGGLLFLLVMIGPRFLPKANPAGRFVSGTVGDLWSVSRLVQLYGQAWLSVQKKVDDLRHADEENSKLRLENAQLKLELESTHLACNQSSGAHKTNQTGLQLDQVTGNRAGRTLASVNYKLPSKLLPSQLYTLGVSYLKAREDEKAAVIFTHLTGLQDSETYKTAKNFLITGMAWYRIENYVLAQTYFDEVLKKTEKEDSIQYQAQARLWKALASKKMNKEIKTQYWLKELIDHHPYSVETSWINTQAVEHVPEQHP